MKFDELKDKWGDPKEKAKIQLILFLIFIAFAVIFTRLTANYNDNNYINDIENTNNNQADILDLISDNYNYNININIETKTNSKTISYGGIRYNNNMIISKMDDENIVNYYTDNSDYYIYTDGNYILSNVDEVYDNINYNYLNISNIKEYIKKGIRDENIYLIKISDINLDSTSKEYITIEVNNTNDDINLLVDYTNLLKNDDIVSCKIEYSYTNIDKVTEEEFNFQKYIEKK